MVEDVTVWPAPEIDVVPVLRMISKAMEGLRVLSELH